MSFYKYFSNAQKETKHIVLDRFFPEERRITSTMTGLQTSLGTFWEKLAVRFSEENDFVVINSLELTKPTVVPTELLSLIGEVKKEREDNGGELNSFKDRLDRLYGLDNIPDVEFMRMTKGKGADLIVSKDNKVFIFDIKTVQINANGGNAFNESLILWTAFYKYKFGVSAHRIRAMLVFPYNSKDEDNDSSWWGDFGGRVSPLGRNDVFVGNDFWSFLTGNADALKDIISGIEELLAEKSFIDLYKQAFNCKSIEDLQKFSVEVKLAQISKRFDVELMDKGSNFSLRKKLQWRHNNSCSFKERFNKVLLSETYLCPVCSHYI